MSIAAIVKVRSLTVENQISFRKVTGVVNWKNLYLHDVHVNAERTVYVFDSEFGFSDSAILLSNKGLSDSLGFLSVEPLFTVGKNLSDSVNVVDSTSQHLNKGVNDPVNLSEAMAFSPVAGRFDSIGFVENVDTLLTFIRTFTSAGNDSHVMIDALSVESDKSLDDSFQFSDLASLEPSKGLSDTAPMSDSTVFSSGLSQQDSVIVVDLLSVTRQPYNFVINALNGVATVTGEPDDSFAMAEAPLSFSASIALQDGYTLDDFAQVDKSVDGVKSNIVTMTESLAFDHYVTGSLLNQSLVGAMVLNG